MSRQDTIRLTTTPSQFHLTSLAVDKTRAGSSTVKVDKVALDALLKDHGAMQRKLREVGIEPVET
jgi:hypothetical protein